MRRLHKSIAAEPDEAEDAATAAESDEARAADAEVRDATGSTSNDLGASDSEKT